MAAEDRQWRVRAKCHGLPPGMFILDRGHQPAVAQSICNGPTYGEPCAVRGQCKAYADAHGMVGVWGGEYISSRDYGINVEVELEAAALDLGHLLVELQDARPHPA